MANRKDEDNANDIISVNYAENKEQEVANNNDDISRGLFIRMVIGCSIGSFVEWYNFTLVQYFHTEIVAQCFPSNISTSMRRLYLSYLPHIARIFGAILFGYISDKAGRRFTLIMNLFLTGVTCVLMGCLPTYDEIGIASTILLVIFRIIQGLSVSSDYPNSMIYIWEQAADPQDEKYALAQALIWSGNLGIIVAELWDILLKAVLSTESLSSWGWRIPFWFSSIFVAVGIYIRFTLPRDPIEDPIHNPVKHLVVTHAIRYVRSFIVLLLAFMLSIIAHTVSFTWLPQYLELTHIQHESFAVYGNILAMFFSFIFMVFVGYLCDIYDTRHEKIRSAFLLDLGILFSLPLILLVISISENVGLLTFEQICFSMIAVCSIPSTMAWCVSYVKNRSIRATFLLLPYNVSYTLASIFAVFVVDYLVSVQSVYGMALSGIFVGIIGMISAFALLHARRYPLELDDYEYEEIEAANIKST